MTQYNDTMGDGVILRFTVTESSTDVGANTSLCAWSLALIKTTGSPWTSNPSSWSVTVGGHTATGTVVYDLRGGSQAISSGTITIPHNSDGTKTISNSSSFTDGGGGLIGNGSASGSLALTTIPRASKSTFSPTSVDAGTSVTINTNRASSSFTHDISYAIGSASGSIATGVGASTTWTPPLSLINELPNSTSGTVTITTVTKNGSTVIGTTTSSLTLTVPSTVLPTFTSITNSDTNSTVVSAVGAYVQSLSTLALAIVGAAGAYSSTIASYKLEVAGQVINAVSGTTTPIQASGTMNITATVTDSRGRSYSNTQSISVLAYMPPSIDNTVFQLRRSDVSGTPAIDSGTYVRTDLKAAVQSLIVSSVQKNALTYKIESRQSGTSTYTTKATVTPGGVTFNSYDVEGTYDITLSWDFRITVSDLFGSTVITSNVPTAAVFMHWGTGLALGKFWAQGGLDVAGQIYQNNGTAVLDTDDQTVITATIAALVPSGSVMNFAGISAPTGWLVCNGSAVSRTTYSSLFAALVTVLGTVTVTIASPGVFTKTSHGLIVGDGVAFSTTGALPTGLTANTLYYVQSVPTGNTFTVAATRGGSAIATTGSQSGTHTLTFAPFGVGDGSTTFNVPDLRGRVTMGTDTTQTEFANRGLIGGAKTHNHPLSSAGQAQISVGASSPGVAANRIATASYSVVANVGTTGSSGGGSFTTGTPLAGNTDSAAALPPYESMSYIIKT